MIRENKYIFYNLVAMRYRVRIFNESVLGMKDTQ